MFNKVLGAVAGKVLPKTQAWLERQVSLAVGDILRRPEGGISFMEHFQKTDKTPGNIAASVLRLLGDDLAKRFQPERKGDLTLSAHYRKGPRPGISVGVYLIEGDHIFEPVFEFVDLEFCPEPVQLNLAKIEPAPPAKPAQSEAPKPRPEPQKAESPQRAAARPKR